MSFPTRTSPRRWLRAAAVVLAAAGAAPLASCTGDVLSVEDPDIINPGDVRSAAGADAVRLGALSRLSAAASGGSAATNNPNDAGDNLFLLGGLFADEWINGDSFIARQEIDQRVVTPENSFLTASNRALHRARLAAEQAVALLAEFSPATPAWQVAEMHFVQAYVVNILAEHFCSGLVFSTVVDGREQYATPISTTAAFERALKHADTGLALITGTTANDLRVKSALQVTRGRILMNLDRLADAAAAVTGVATSFRYQTLHSQTTESNYIYVRNNLNRRYSVGNGEGTNGINFATARDPRVPVCQGGDAACRGIGVTLATRDDLGPIFHVQMLWPARETPVTIVGGIEARMIEAEAQLRAPGANPATALATLNAARTTVTGLAPLTDAGTDAARVNQLFRERAFWLFGRGHRVGDLRRLVRQYGRPANTVFPTGAWHKNDGAYGADVTLPIPTAERNNPALPAGEICLDRNA